MAKQPPKTTNKKGDIKMILDSAELNKLIENTIILLKGKIEVDAIEQIKSNLLELIDAKISEALDAHLEEYAHQETGLKET